MRSCCARVALAFCSGYIIAYYGEFVFWATPDREGLNVGGIIATWLLYSIMPAAPKALCVLPPLMGVTFWALFKNRRVETCPNAIVAFSERAKPLNYLLLFAIPFVACAIYYPAVAHRHDGSI